MKQLKYQVILLDLDGTLYDFQRAEQKAIVDLVSEWGLPCSEEAVKAYHDFNDACWKALERGEITKSQLQSKRFEGFLSYLQFEYDPVLAGQEYAEKLSHNGFLLPGAKELMQALAQRYTLYAVTNGIQKVQLGRMAASGIGKYFEKMFVSEEVGAAKPHTAYFEYVFAHIRKVRKEEILLIGDSISSDMQGGMNAGIDTLWYNPLHEPLPSSIQVTYEMDSLQKIQKFLTQESILSAGLPL